MNYNFNQQPKKTARVRETVRSRSRTRMCIRHGPRGGAEHRAPQPLPPSLRHRRETPHFCWATRWVLKAMFACPEAQRTLPGPSTPLAPKPPSLRLSSGRTSRSSPTSSAPIQTPTRLPQTRYPSAARRGRVPSIAARCGHSPAIRHVDPRRLRPELPEYRRDCLPLTAVDRIATGPTGGKVLTKTTFIQRLNTKGGSAPADGCSDSPPMWVIKRSCRTLPTTTSSARKDLRIRSSQRLQTNKHFTSLSPCAREVAPLLGTLPCARPVGHNRGRLSANSKRAFNLDAQATGRRRS